MRALLAIALASCTHTVYVAVPGGCDSRAAEPAVRCLAGVHHYNGCRWSCEVEPVEMEPAHLVFTFKGYEAKE